MQYREFGLILFVEDYDECIAFYRDVLQLAVRKEKETLVTFELPNGYLMVEWGGAGSKQEKSRELNPTVLRFDRILNFCCESIRRAWCSIFKKKFNL